MFAILLMTKTRQNVNFGIIVNGLLAFFMPALLKLLAFTTIESLLAIAVSSHKFICPSKGCVKSALTAMVTAHAVVVNSILVKLADIWIGLQ